MLSQFKKDEISWELRKEDTLAGQYNKYNQPLPEQLILSSGHCKGCPDNRYGKCYSLTACPFA